MRHTWLRGFGFVAVFVMSCVAFAAPGAKEDIATIKRLSQAFSDASASGDAKVLGSLLDENVVFMNESGRLSSRHDIVAGATPPPKGAKNKLVQSDFHVTLHGNVAVTSFTDNATFDIYDHAVHDSFRSTEVWLKEHGKWKMISSQTIEVPVEPPQIDLSTSELAQYVGDYQVAAGHVLHIKRQGDGLVTIGRSNKPVPLLAEASDVMFRKGSPRVRFVFDRDGAGRVAGFDVRRAGHVMERFTRL